MPRALKGATIVITGASSGIGRAAARAFAAAGSNVVLAARNGEILADLARECERLGIKALAVAADTGDSIAVQHLAERAASFGGGVIDVWVNNAGVAAFGRFLDTPIDAHDQVIRTNLMGYIHGAHAVLPYFQKQGRGILINVVSMAAWAPTPLAASYSASKFGNRGFSETLRVEIAGSGQDIHVCDLYPAFVDTPILEHTANYAGKQIKPVPPVVAVDKVADKIVALAQRPRPTTPMGAAFPMATFFHFAFPRLFRGSVGHAAEAYLAAAPDEPRTDAGLFRASPGSHESSGGLRSPKAPGFATGAVIAGAALGGALLLLGSSRRKNDDDAS